MVVPAIIIIIIIIIILCSSMCRLSGLFGGQRRKERTERKEREQLPLRHCMVMLRASSPLNKVMETPRKRGPRLGQSTRKPAKRGLLSSQENITETDFLVGSWPFCFRGLAETRKGKRQNKVRPSSRCVPMFGRSE